MTTKKLISIIIPTYNEGLGILLFLEELKKELKNLLTEYIPEIIIIDDDSPDGTAKIIESRYTSNKDIRVYVRKRVRGLGTAIGYGINKARGRIIIGMDADGNHDVKEIKTLLKELNNFDLVVASRFIQPVLKKNIFGALRHFGSFIFNAFLKIILGFPVWDNTSGFYVINKSKLIELGLSHIYYGYGDYHLRLMYYARKNGYRIKEVPCVYHQRLAGTSKSNLLKMLINYLIESYKLIINQNGKR